MKTVLRSAQLRHTSHKDIITYNRAINDDLNLITDLKNGIVLKPHARDLCPRSQLSHNESQFILQSYSYRDGQLTIPIDGGNTKKFRCKKMDLKRQDSISSKQKGGNKVASRLNTWLKWASHS